MTKAIALLSGGLDSILATKLMLEQGIDVEAVNFVTVFCNCTSKGKSCLASKSAADKLGIKLKVFEVSKQYFEIIKKPKHGYGRNLNPCLDCRIFMFKKAAEYMKESGASFIVTGEVLGSRPMSQRRDAMRIIERDSDLKGMIVRPLSANLLEPTIPEEKGLVDRAKLLSIRGRSRKPQIQMAKDFGINDYPCPAGGCLLTDPGFAKRMRDLMEDKPDFSTNDVHILKTGRHFRLDKGVKLVVGRDEKENERLTNLCRKDDLCFWPSTINGPVGIGRGNFNNLQILEASSIIARYSDGKLNQDITIEYEKALSDSRKESIIVKPMEEDRLALFRI
ncbi:MAG: hypothetical protein HQ579_04860 [Candidatus Omnitrophica bacterium]|nr:hypothetical protein [Candidatus Omnitrophota bacterium]